jgi:hypothetical protein
MNVDTIGKRINGIHDVVMKAIQKRTISLKEIVKVITELKRLLRSV